MLGFVSASSLLLAQDKLIQVDVKAKKKKAEIKGDGELYRDWKTYDTRTVDGLANFQPLVEVSLSKYGGDINRKVKATGFFYTTQIDGRWWIVDPDGYAGVYTLVNSISIPKGERNKKAFAEKFKSKKDWMEQTAALCHDLYFDGAGSWSDTEQILMYNKQPSKSLAYCVMLNMMSGYGKERGGTYQLPGNTGYPNQCIFAFDPEFEKYCDKKAKELAKYKNDKNLFGYFSDNEMPLARANLEGYLDLEKSSDPGRAAAEQFLKGKGITREQITDEQREEFAGIVAEKYYSVVRNAIKKHDPNHLYLGSRLHGSAPHTAGIVKVVGKYTDVLTVNYYGQWTPSAKHLNDWATWAPNAPFMITEFYTKGMDSGLANQSGAGWIVRTQQDRGYAYQHFCLALLEAKNCVGWHWFKYIDNDPTAKGVDPSNVDGNKGLLNNDFVEYEPLVQLMKQLNMNRYALINYFDAKK